MDSEQVIYESLLKRTVTMIQTNKTTWEEWHEAILLTPSIWNNQAETVSIFTTSRLNLSIWSSSGFGRNHMFVFIKSLLWEFLFINCVVDNTYSENHKKYSIWDLHASHVSVETSWQSSGQGLPQTEQEFFMGS